MGLNLKIERVKRRMTQKQLSEISGVSVDNIRSIENGRNTNPKLKVMLGISKALGMTIEELFIDEQ